ncbi:hypothetical protein M2140_000073 [Clostridiales Family XIII bacterium PM5-7]
MMIDEKKLIEELNSIPLENIVTADVLKQAIEVVKKQPKVGGWIPFKWNDEECSMWVLPEKNQKILVTDGYNVWTDIWKHCCLGVWLESGNIDKAKAWMPYPERYKGA